MFGKHTYASDSSLCCRCSPNAPLNNPTGGVPMSISQTVAHYLVRCFACWVLLISRCRHCGSCFSFTNPRTYTECRCAQEKNDGRAPAVRAHLVCFHQVIPHTHMHTALPTCTGTLQVSAAMTGKNLALPVNIRYLLTGDHSARQPNRPRIRRASAAVRSRPPPAPSRGRAARCAGR